MGYLRHKALLVNGWDDKAVAAARDQVAALYEGADGFGYAFDDLVSPIIRHAANGGASFLIAPDGSKEGWEGSQLGDDLFERAKAIIAEHEWVDWCEVLCGGDDDQFAILDSSSASADTRPEGGAAVAAPFTGGAMPSEASADAQTPSTSPRELTHDSP